MSEATKTKPASGPATTYGYDQAGDLTSVERPKEGEVSEIKDTYAYNGEGLRTSQTISGTSTFLAWDMTEGLPLILDEVLKRREAANLSRLVNLAGHLRGGRSGPG